MLDPAASKACIFGELQQNNFPGGGSANVGSETCCCERSGVGHASAWAQKSGQEAVNCACGRGSVVGM
jgi:hypothetical protein